MEENNNMSEVIDKINGASKEELRELIEKWFESTRMDGMRLGAYMIAAAVSDTINKNLKNGMNSSYRDFERAIKRIIEIVSVQLKRQKTLQNDLEESSEEIINDRTAE